MPCVQKEDIISFDSDDGAIPPDRPQDVKPRFHKARLVCSGNTGAGRGIGQDDAAQDVYRDCGTVRAARLVPEAGEEEDAEDEDEEDGDVSEWNLRKCSASGLDVLAGTFREAVLPALLPLLQERLASPHWEVRESGILALGAIAEGCLSAIHVYLPQLMPWLFQTLGDPNALIRSITCWTLSRYSKSVPFARAICEPELPCARTFTPGRRTLPSPRRHAIVLFMGPTCRPEAYAPRARVRAQMGNRAARSLVLSATHDAGIAQARAGPRQEGAGGCVLSICNVRGGCRGCSRTVSRSNTPGTFSQLL